MAIVEARSGGPPGGVANIVTPCPLGRAYLTITVRNAHANSAALGNTEVRVELGGEARVVTTNANGLVTLVLDSLAALTDQSVTVTLTDATRAWPGTRHTVDAATPHNRPSLRTLSVVVKGTFEVTVFVRTIRPGVVGAILWRWAWTPDLLLRASSTPPGGVAAAQNLPFTQHGDAPEKVRYVGRLDCVTAHALTVALRGFIPAVSRVVFRVDGHDGELIAGGNDATTRDVTYRRIDGNGAHLRVPRHNANVQVCLDFIFPRLLVVGEGTYFEYALGVAEKYGDARHERGFRWVVATQYDVTAINDLPQDMTILDWATGDAIEHVDVRARVTAAHLKNLVIRTTRFDATNAAHWAALPDTYNLFDAIVFNNPHPGYGMHKCEVLGLSTDAAHRNNNGRAVSVYSVGYAGAHAVDSAETRALLFDEVVASDRDTDAIQGFEHQRSFVRVTLGHTNLRTTPLALQFNPANTAALPLTIETAFNYYDDSRVDGRFPYGDAAEMAHDRQAHYRSRVNSIGLQQYLLRAYRYHARGALKSGGALYVNGSTSWEDFLVADFTCSDGTAIGAMTNVARWRDHNAWFVRYRTNFTSTRHHPSWYASARFEPGEPELNNARAFRWVKP